MSIYHVKTNAVPDWTGTVTVYNQAGVSSTTQATALVRPSDWNSQHVLAYTLTGNTTQNSTVSGTAIPISGAGGVSVGATNGSLIISGATYPAQSVQTQNMVSIQGSTGAISFANSNGVSFGFNASTITATVKTDYLTTAAVSNHSHNLATTTTNGSLIVVATTNSAGATFAVPPYLTTAQPVGAYLTTAAQSNQVVNSLNGSTGQISLNVGSSLSSSTNGSSITFGLASNITTALQSVGAYLTTAALSNHSHNFATTTTNGSLIVVGTTNSAGATIGVPPFLTTAAQSDHSHGNPTLALTNLTGTTASNSAGFTLSLSGAGGGVINQTGPNIAAGTQTATSGTVVFSNSNNITFGMSDNSVVTASFNPINIGMSTNGNTAGTTGTFDGAGLQYVLVGGNNITLSQSANGSSVSLSIVGGAGGGGATLNSWANINFHTNTISNVSNSGNFWYVVPLRIEQNVTADRIRVAQSYSHVSTSLVSTANTTFSYNHQATHDWVLYTRGTGASSISLISISSGQRTSRWSHNQVYGSASNTSQGYTVGCTLFDAVGTSSNSTSYSTSNLSTFAISSAAMTNLNLGNMARFVDFPFVGSLSAGEYYFLWRISTTHTTQGTAVLSTCRPNYSNMCQGEQMPTLGYFGKASNSSIQFLPQAGAVTVAGGVSTSNIHISNISYLSALPYVSIGNSAGFGATYTS